MSVDTPVKGSTAERPLTAVESVPVWSASQQSSLPQDAAAQYPWPHPILPKHTDWEEFARFPNFWEGHILGGLLKNEGLPTIIEFMYPDLGLRSYSVVWVPRELMHRARWILSWPVPTDAELTFLATGEMPHGSDDGPAAQLDR